MIANKELIALNQDALGIQAKRIFSTLEKDRPDTEYITNIDRVDILAKPLGDNSVAISFINVSEADKNEGYRTDVETIIKFIGRKMVNADAFKNAKSYSVKDLFTGETTTSNDGVFKVSSLKACGNVTLRISVND